MSSDDDEDFLSWDMLDDRKFVMRPGYKFPSAMSYKEMCQQVNMEVQKAGSDAVRHKIRKTASVGTVVAPCRLLLSSQNLLLPQASAQKEGQTLEDT